jgi:DNA-binding Lrp family transcriptional regulator
MGAFVADLLDQRLIAALQCDGRVTAERAAEVLGIPVRAVQRRWAALMAEGHVEVVASPPRPPVGEVMLLRVRVLRGKLETVARSLADREDVPLVDLSAGGDQVIAVLIASADDSSRLVFRQLPATSAVVTVDAQTVIHVYTDAAAWTLDVLTAAERAGLTPVRHGEVTGGDSGADPTDRVIADVLARDGRASAAVIARAAGRPESTVRRRLAALLDQGRIRTRVIVDPRILGLPVDANLRMQVPPARLDETGRALAQHPAVHGALATTGAANLHAAVWLRDLDHLYQFITLDLAGLGVASVDTTLIGETMKRPADW